MGKKIILVVINDVHLRQDNIDLVKKSISQVLAFCVENGIPNIEVAGDFFDSRSSQKLSVMKSFSEILDMCSESGVTMRMIHGNHDLSSYSESYSWLSPFAGHKSLTLFSEPTVIKEGGKTIAYLPFQSDEIIVDNLNSIGEADILISHFEMNGSVSNGITSVEKSINKSMLSKFGLVLLGHFHDKHNISDNIYHMASLYQKNFAETCEKGFTVVYDDLSFEHKNIAFKTFKTLSIDIDTYGKDDMKKLLKEAKKGDCNIRVDVHGSDSSLAAFDKSKFRDAGIEVKVVKSKITEIVSGDQYRDEVGDVRAIDTKSAFSLFCKKNELNEDEGKQYIFVKNEGE